MTAEDDPRITLMTADDDPGLDLQRPRFDLQGHSTQSDGELSPAETVQAARRAGVELFALTDHDSVAGVGEAAGAAAEVGLDLVTGVEISVLDPVAADLHLCG